MLFFHLKINYMYEKREIMSATELANRYGFRIHKDFILYIKEYFPDCIQELEVIGWQENNKKLYLPILIEIIEKYLGKPKYKKVTPHELARIYGYSRFEYLRPYFDKYDSLRSELENMGWKYGIKYFIPMWIEIVVRHLGTPKKIDEIIIKD